MISLEKDQGIYNKKCPLTRIQGKKTNEVILAYALFYTQFFLGRVDGSVSALTKALFK